MQVGDVYVHVMIVSDSSDHLGRICSSTQKSAPTHGPLNFMFTSENVQPKNTHVRSNRNAPQSSASTSYAIPNVCTLGSSEQLVDDARQHRCLEASSVLDVFGNVFYEEMPALHNKGVDNAFVVAQLFSDVEHEMVFGANVLVTVCFNV